MKWPELKYSRRQVDKAGEFLANPPDFDDEQAMLGFDIGSYVHSYEVLNNWRSCHTYPINTFQATLRATLKKIDDKAIVAQRLKRAESIVGKLRKESMMKLSQMQDIGGLRAVVGGLDKVYELVANYENKNFEHEFVKKDDYILSPKKSGYRCIHLVYKYNNSKRSEYNKLRIELQIRTKLQHAWATSVETMGTFIDHALKSSSGPKEFLDFFSVTGSAFAYLEETPPVKKYIDLTRNETFRKVVEESKRLQIKEKLKAFSRVAGHVGYGKNKGHYHLVVLDVDNKQVDVTSYGLSRLDQANIDYAAMEKRISQGEKIQAVLVSAGSIELLKKAYPNYFLDTREFLSHLDRLESMI